MGSLRSLRRREVEPVIIPLPSDEEIMRAVELGDFGQTEILLKRGANPNAENDFVTALGGAAYDKKIELVNLLVRHGADVNQRNHRGLAPLHEAALTSWKAAQKISRLLLDEGAYVDAVDRLGRTPLILAVGERNVDLVKLLLERGADATLMNVHGEKALDLVGRNRHTAALKALLEPVS
jgi:uncharacterized protein